MNKYVKKIKIRKSGVVIGITSAGLLAAAIAIPLTINLKKSQEIPEVTIEGKSIENLASIAKGLLPTTIDAKFTKAFTQGEDISFVYEVQNASDVFNSLEEVFSSKNTSSSSKAIVTLTFKKSSGIFEKETLVFDNGITIVITDTNDVIAVNYNNSILKGDTLDKVSKLLLNQDQVNSIITLDTQQIKDAIAGIEDKIAPKAPIAFVLDKYLYNGKQYDTEQKARAALEADVHPVQVYKVDGVEYQDKDKAIEAWLNLDIQTSQIKPYTVIKTSGDIKDGTPTSGLTIQNGGFKGYEWDKTIYPSAQLAKEAWLASKGGLKKPAVKGHAQIKVTYQGKTKTFDYPFDKVTPTKTSILNYFKWDLPTGSRTQYGKQYTLSFNGKDVLTYTPVQGENMDTIGVANILVTIDTPYAPQEDYKISDAPATIDKFKTYITRPLDAGSTKLTELDPTKKVDGYTYGGKFYNTLKAAQTEQAKTFSLKKVDSATKITLGSDPKIYDSIDQAYVHVTKEVTSAKPCITNVVQMYEN